MVLLLPECVVCVSEFDDDSAVPRVLTSCGHSLCATCITALAAPWTLPSSASASSSALIPPSGPASALPSASAPAASAPSAAAANATSLIVRCPECSDASLLHTLSGPAHRITALTLANTAAPRGASAAIRILLPTSSYGGAHSACLLPSGGFSGGCQWIVGRHHSSLVAPRPLPHGRPRL
ncbi:unnamed protein product [Closterium sp. NIES-65]|nr:unnamed protein product [Closterium sp. NIES-65]CAI5988481.1 unnamed protein product [Closterium sp. NIES-65]